MKLSKQILRTIKSQTELNDHSGAILTAAQALGHEEVAKRISVIIHERDRIGYLHWKHVESQRVCRIDLLLYAKDVMTESDYNELHGAF